MVDTLNRVYSEDANPREFTAGELNEPTLQEADGWYTLFSAQADNTTTYGAGFGIRDENLNVDGWSDLDLKDNSTSPVDIEGQIRFRVYRDSSKNDLVAQSGTYTLNSLRNAVSAARKDKALLPAMYEYVPRTDGYMTVEVQPSPSSTGLTVGAGNSKTDQGIAYGELNF